MALIKEQMQQAQGPEQAPQQAPKQGGGEKYKRLLQMLLKFLYSEQGIEMTKQAVSQEDIATGIGQVVGHVMGKVLNDAQQQGKKIPPIVIMRAAIEFTQAVMEMASETGKVPQEQIDQIAQKAFNAALQRIAQVTQDPQEREQYAQMTDAVYGGQA